MPFVLVLCGQLLAVISSEGMKANKVVNSATGGGKSKQRASYAMISVHAQYVKHVELVDQLIVCVGGACTVHVRNLNILRFSLYGLC